jgi:hypothetical protein
MSAERRCLGCSEALQAIGLRELNVNPVVTARIPPHMVHVRSGCDPATGVETFAQRGVWAVMVPAH